ncbi:MAG: hypothetical protein KIS73_24960 [Enhydrobacter sp.]|nr:hypothetical protein [Enhydrobacter sp.]
MANDADTPLSYLMPRLSRSAFTELQPTMTGEEDFPRTFEEWEALWDDRHRDVEGDGHKAVFVDVIPAAFAKFCKARGKPASWNSLGEFITAKAGR